MLKEWTRSETEAGLTDSRLIVKTQRALPLQ